MTEKPACCNLQPDNSCLGAGFKVKPTGHIANRLLQTADKPCAILQGKKCEFHAYAVSPARPQHNCRDCNAPTHRRGRCPACQRKHARQTTRERVKKHRTQNTQGL